MRTPLAHRLRSWSLITLLIGSSLPTALSEPVPVRHLEGTVHGFLELRSEDGHIVASGDAIQYTHGDQVTSHTIFTFKDGSVDDETTVFTQRRTLHLITDHHIQKGPSFPHPMDAMIDARSGQVTVRSIGKDGKEDVTTDHLTLPPDLANGLVPIVIENMAPHVTQSEVSMLVFSPKPRLAKLDISSTGEDAYSVVGSPRKAIHYEIKIKLDGVAGVVAPLIGKAPPTIQLWVVGGEAPTFVRELGPLYAEGPMMTIQLVGPVWPNAQTSGE